LSGRSCPCGKLANRDLSTGVVSSLVWIESYVDPSNMRAYWEGMVAIVNKEQSKKFSDLVKASE